jgi:oligosaccharyl transferase (archaeosortase A-associated)
MNISHLKKHQPYIIVGLLLVFMGVSFILRVIPAAFIKDAGFLYIFDTDSWYTMRQVEVMVRHFPQYNWFDPMTAYPTGKLIDWGPLFAGIAAIVCLIAGATTRSAIIFTSGWVSPILAVIMVPVVYQLGKTLWNRKAGIIAAGLISVVSIQFFSLSSYGWTDHHIAEVLFSSLFFLAYSFTLSYVKSQPINLKIPETLLLPVLYSGIAGVLFFLALLSSTTVILTLGVIAAYTLIQSVLDFFSNQRPDSLLAINSTFLIVSVILLFLFGFRNVGVSLSQYTIGIVYVHLILLLGTVVLFVPATIYHGNRRAYLLTLLVLTAGTLILTLIIPLFQTMLVQILGLLFGFSIFSVAVVETLPWTLTGAWENFNIALILMSGGFLWLGYRVLRKRDSQAVFLLIWSLFMLILTVRFQRFAYFFTVNIVLLSAICIIESIGLREDFFSKYWSGMISPAPDSVRSPVDTEINNPRKKPVHAKKDSRKINKSTVKSPSDSNKFLKNSIVFSVLLLTAAMLAISISQNVTYGISTPLHEISDDWKESLTWLQSNTPDTGVDYYKSHDSGSFSYPAESYGILAVWDSGHWITFFSQRIPITNPFQDNLGGRSGAAAYFLSQNESQANDILHSLGGKYVITNSEMAIDTFTNLVPWQSNSVDISPYIKWFMLPDFNNPSRLHLIHMYDRAYFQTMVSRLHNFDGSMVTPQNAEYVQYVIRQVPAAGETSGDVNGYARVITSRQEKNISQTDDDISLIREGSDLSPGRYADIFSSLPNRTTGEISALRHYRLIHESTNDASVKIFPESDPQILSDVKNIKIFEYVNGAHIAGNGIIELPVITNTGRAFIYKQASQNGEFIVPYSTQGELQGVHATGKYHIVGSSRFITVTEKDVTEGNTPLG